MRPRPRHFYSVFFPPPPPLFIEYFNPRSICYMVLYSVARESQ